MRVRFLLPLPEFWANNGRNTGENWTNFMKKMLEFIKSVRAEWFKIVWPSRDDVTRATIMILVFSGLAALFFFVVDSALNAIVSWIF
ncbi:MAG: preprotein translocase subunit SecE [Alphaproteobacteria bacterium]|nr:preprotein translocase subunit SecE [Alphaproteobacteria bacterium]